MYTQRNSPCCKRRPHQPGFHLHQSAEVDSAMLTGAHNSNGTRSPLRLCCTCPPSPRTTDNDRQSHLPALVGSMHVHTLPACVCFEGGGDVSTPYSHAHIHKRTHTHTCTHTHTHFCRPSKAKQPEQNVPVVNLYQDQDGTVCAQNARHIRANLKSAGWCVVNRRKCTKYASLS